MRSAATIDPHAHAPARLDLACNSLSFAGKCRRRRTLNGRPPVREPAILEPRGGDSAWEDGGSAVLQVPLLQPVVRFSQRRRVGSLSRVVHRVGPLIRERWITKPAICVCISFFWCGCRSGSYLSPGRSCLRGAKRSRGLRGRCSTSPERELPFATQRFSVPAA
jgi:hypothetical protein